MNAPLLIYTCLPVTMAFYACFPGAWRSGPVSGQSYAMDHYGYKHCSAAPPTESIHIVCTPARHQPYPYSVSVRFRPPKDKYGRGKQPRFTAEHLHDDLRDYLAVSGSFAEVMTGAETPAQLIIEGELTNFAVSPGEYSALVTIDLFDATGRPLKRYSYRGTQDIANGLDFDHWAYLAVFHAFAAAIDAIEGDLASGTVHVTP